MSYLEKASQLYAMIGEGKSMEALDQFYAEDCVITEGDGKQRHGLAAQKEAMTQWYGMIKEQHGGGVGCITANEDTGITTVESWVDITMQNDARWKMEEVAVQKWENDKIVSERFYYNVPPGM